MSIQTKSFRRILLFVILVFVFIGMGCGGGKGAATPDEEVMAMDYETPTYDQEEYEAEASPAGSSRSSNRRDRHPNQNQGSVSYYSEPRPAPTPQHPQSSVDEMPRESYEEDADGEAVGDASRGGGASYLGTNAYYSNTYQGGQGNRERMETLITEGILIDGKQIKLDAFTGGYSQDFAIPFETAMALYPDAMHTKIAAEGGTATLQVGLQAIKQESSRRPPLNICLVLDISGSMNEENKMEAAKDAAKAIIDRLSEQDFFSLVVYSDMTEVKYAAQQVSDKDGIKALVDKIMAGGGTNIYAGLTLGYEEVVKFTSADTLDMVILLSDGNVSAGETRKSAFKNLTHEAFMKNIQTTSIGLGMDYNEDLMIAIAQSGKGNYHFISDTEQISSIVRKELDELTQVVARAVKVRIVLPEDVRLTKVYGSNQLSEADVAQTRATERHIDEQMQLELGIVSDRDEEDEEGIKFLIPNFFRGDSHVILIEVEVPPGTGEKKVADVFLKYKDIVFGTNEELQKPITLRYTEDRNEVITSLQPHVKKNQLGYKTGEVLLEAVNLLTMGQNAAVVDVLERHILLLETAARQWQDRDLQQDALLLGEFKTIMQGFGSTSLAGTDLGNYLRKSMQYIGYQRQQ
jgi:Mg-chelatase subunit ChlD